MAQRRKPKGPGGGRFAGRHADESTVSLDEDVERILGEAVAEAGSRRQAPPPKTEDAKEARLGATLVEIRRQLGLAEAFAADGWSTFRSSAERRLAVERLLEVLGEQAKRLPARYRTERDSVDWRGLVGLRDRLSHGYGDDIDAVVLWRAITVDLPVLRLAIEES